MEVWFALSMTACFLVIIIIILFFIHFIIITKARAPFELPELILFD